MIKYLSLFTGIGGFELGIQYATKNLSNTQRLQQGGIPRDISDIEQKLLGEEQSTCIGFSEFDPSCDGQVTEGTKKVKCKGYHSAISEFESQCDTCGKIKTQYVPKVYKHHFPTHHNYGDITKINAEELPDFDLLVGGFPCQTFSIAGKRKGFDDTRGTLFFDIARILRAKQPRLFLLENVKGLLSHDNGNTFRTIISTLDELRYDLQWQVINSKNHGVPQNRERIFIVGHLRGTSRPEVFPFGGQSNENTTIGESTKTAVARTLTGGGHSGGNHSGMTIVQLNNPTHSNDRVYGEEGISPTLNTMQGGNRQPFVAAMRGRNPENSSDRTVGAPTEQRLEINEKGTSNTLTSVAKDNLVISKTVRSGGRASPHGSKQNWDSYEVEGKIRRLTPVECMRLQGFPDNWCDVGFDDVVISDSQKYKMAGNAVTVNVIRDIMEKLLA